MGIKLGLSSIRACLAQLHNPHLQYKTVHVAGTNGKGSVCAAIANACNLAGIRTGLFTSPHLIQQWDGISIASQTVEADDYHAIAQEVDQASCQVKLTSFERLTAVAFRAFHKHKVELAVIETGLGGRLDATNVIKPVLSVITRIGLDHQSFLGNDLVSIAREKAGIIKSGASVILYGGQDDTRVIETIRGINEGINPSLKLQISDPGTKDFRQANADLARLALENLAITFPQLTRDIIEDGIRTASWPARFETLDLSIIGGPEKVLLDGAHNEQSIQALKEILPRTEQPMTFIFAATDSKNPGMFTSLLRPEDRFVAVQFEPVDGMPWISPMSSRLLYQSLVAQGFRGRDMGTDLAAALKTTSGTCTICGSLYLAGQIHRLLKTAQLEAGNRIKSHSMPTYNPAEIETTVQAYWKNNPENTHCSPQTTTRDRTFLLPPPNITGKLHIGHALTIAIQDAFVRFFRASGDAVSWIPGIDHAGIATQSVVSKDLAKRGIRSQDLARPDFVSEIWKWRETYGNTITSQIKALGASLDWENEFFTLDCQRSAAVNEAFLRLWLAGLIKRKKKMVNWSTKLQTVISDIEVEALPLLEPMIKDGTPFGHIWTINYQLENSGSIIEVQTTRPETIFGDRYLAVHPNDDRYSALIGQFVIHPLLPHIKLKIITAAMVDPHFGSGIVKITPAHDVTDYAVHLEHPDIPIIQVYGSDGVMLPVCEIPEVVGLDRLQARPVVVNLLRERGCLESIKPHKMTLSLCSRSGDIIEPRLMEQWFIDMKPLAESVLERDEIKMSARTEQEWRKWLENIQDWCISRQLIWGHRVPLWFAKRSGKWVYGTTYEEASANALDTELTQDVDVLDTWFSSALLPLSAFGWPAKHKSSSYPLCFIESGPDILFFWLARMAMLCTFLSPSKSAPFKEVVLHPLVRDSIGRKMSKSLGNVIDPMDIIKGASREKLTGDLYAGNLSSDELKDALKESMRDFPTGIPALGTDALRFGLVHSTLQDRTLNLDFRMVELGSYVCLKLWNTVKFYVHHKKAASQNASGPNEQNRPQWPMFDNFILVELQVLLKSSVSAFEERQLHMATESLRTFVVSKLCDVYLEFLKVDLQLEPQLKLQRLALLHSILSQTLVLAHPFLPFLTEYLWHQLDHESSITKQPLPVVSPPADASQHQHTEAEYVMTVLKHLRSLQGTAILGVADADAFRLLKQFQPHLKKLSSLKGFEISQDIQETVLIPGLTVTRSGNDEVLLKRREKARAKLENITGRMQGANYHKVPAHVREKDEQMAKELSALLQV